MRLCDVNIADLSPAMRQYVEIKNKYKKHILFFRLGDFYEMFFDDAITVSRELEITLTGKDCGLSERAPMCGVPYHACDLYLKKLIEKGYMVAICEQTADPSTCKGIVPREVIRVVTPGTLIESSLLDETSNNYICSYYGKGKECAVCFADISTGEVHLFNISGKDMANSAINELSRFSPVEILFNDAFLGNKELNGFVKDKLKATVQLLDNDDFSPEIHRESVMKQFSVEDFSQLNINENSLAAFAVTGLFHYISETQKALIGRFSKIVIHDSEPIMTIGFTARRNLELCETLRNKEKKGSLLWVLDHTKTSMGKRMLKTYIEQPLIKPAKIIDSLDAVEQLIKSPVELEELIDALSGVYDLERLMTRVMYKTATPRDLKALSVTALVLPSIKAILSGFNSKLITSLNDSISTLEAVSNLVENAIVDEPPAYVKDGGVI